MKMEMMKQRRPVKKIYFSILLFDTENILWKKYAKTSGLAIPNMRGEVSAHPRNSGTSRAATDSFFAILPMMKKSKKKKAKQFVRA
jgi:hypothetical protein